MSEIILYHGTTRENALNIAKNGWKPYSGKSGSNCGQNKYLYVTNSTGNAKWFAEAKTDRPFIIKLTVKKEDLAVDPEDGCYDSVEEELNNRYQFPAYLVLKKEIKPKKIKVINQCY